MNNLEVSKSDQGVKNMENEWISVTEKLPPVEEIVETKRDGSQEISKCKLRKDGTWFVYIASGFGGELDPDFYPTHWRKMEVFRGAKSIKRLERMEFRR